MNAQEVNENSNNNNNNNNNKIIHTIHIVFNNISSVLYAKQQFGFLYVSCTVKPQFLNVSYLEQISSKPSCFTQNLSQL